MNLTSLRTFYQRLLLLLPFTTVPESFDYKKPDEWQVQSPQCAGFAQSPVSIHEHKAIPASLAPIIFGNYDDLLIEHIHLHNNGHTVEFSIPQTTQGLKPYITGGLLEDIYEAVQVHFHWGSLQKKGSEHALNGKRYDLEMHIVHRNVKYRDMETARRFVDGISVVGVFFKVVKSMNVYFPGLNALYDSLPDVTAYNSSTEVPQLITLGSLLGNIDRNDFYTYHGSLTTPPCAEAVIWQVFSSVVPISDRELPKFWRFNDSHGQILLNNFRPLQPLNFRKIFHRSSALYNFLHHVPVPHPPIPVAPHSLPSPPYFYPHPNVVWDYLH